MSDFDQEFEQVDTDLQDLLGDPPASAPDFSSLFDDEDSDQDDDNSQEGVSAQEMQQRGFPEVTRFQEDTPRAIFSEKSYYQKVLSGEGDVAKRVHKALADFLNAKDPQDRTVYRQKLGVQYWALVENLALKLGSQMDEEKRIALRFGYLLPTMISKEQREMLGRVIFRNELGQPIHYADEWLEKVAYGEVNRLATDEEFSYRKGANDNSAIRAKLEKFQGTEHAQIMLLLGKQNERDALEEQLKRNMESLLTHTLNHRYTDLTSLYDESQRGAMKELNNLLRRLSVIDRDMQREYNALTDISAQVSDTKMQLDQAGAETQVDQKLVTNEVNSLRQMAKMSVGRQGNHFPILMKQYFCSRIEEMATRENILVEMKNIEQIDPGLFMRSFKTQINRIVPHVIIVPCYGERGLCWEPFEKFNKATSRGRIGVPLFPKDLKDAVITALADLRWQVAKEKAQHYWMEEGLTGKYYQWFSDNKMKGDVRMRFIDDYYLWVTKESQGIQKLDRDVRGVFWRNMPFPDPIRENLKNRGFVYSELYKNDVNRSKSAGY